MRIRHVRVPGRRIDLAARFRDDLPIPEVIDQCRVVGGSWHDRLLQQRADCTPQLVERGRALTRQCNVESGGKRRLICGRSIRRLHMPAKPLLGATNRLRLARCNEVAGESAAARDGLNGSEEPCLILTLRQDCFDTPIRARSTGPGKESGTKTRRTRSVGVKQDQNTAAAANALRGETDVCFQ